MRLFPRLTLGCSVEDFRGRSKKKIILRTLFNAAEMVLILAFTLGLRGYSPSLIQTGGGSAPPVAKVEVPSSPEPTLDSNALRVMNLANMIRSISNDTLPAPKALMYAGLISDAAEKYEVNPLEIIALIKIESNFKEASINTKTGDYGLGQINWEHWGRHNDLTSEDILDPAVNISMTCQVYKYFGKDFGRYHRGNGIQCEAYRANVNSILSTLNALAETLEGKG